MLCAERADRHRQNDAYQLCIHWIICNSIFTGFGLALAGELERSEIHPIVVGIWSFQQCLTRGGLRNSSLVQRSGSGVVILKGKDNC